MSQSNRELVVDFLSYKFFQKGYSWSQFSDMEENRTETLEGTESDMETPSAISGNPSWHLADSPVVNGATGHRRSLDARKMIPMAVVKQALREASNECELRYQQTFSDLTSQLHITPGKAYQSFEQVINELFQDGVNWGCNVAFFSFGGALCMKSIVKEMQVLVSQVTTWMATYLNVPRALDPGEWRLGHFCGTLRKQYSNQEPKGPRAPQPLVPDRHDCGQYGSAGLALQHMITIPFVIVIQILYKLTFLFLLL